MNICQFSQLGKRPNNEDRIGVNDFILTVCDGMGGHVSGERASSFVVENLLQYFRNSIEGLNKISIQNYLDIIQRDLNRTLESEPELERMGTTFTGVFRTENVWYAAHIGDSRIYLFRSSEHKLWHTWDHSLVGDLVRNGDITREAGRHHPMSNRIGKAIIANTEGVQSKASVFKIDQLQENDIFLLCSDGVIEAWSDYDLCKLIFDDSYSFEDKCDIIQRKCNQFSTDNNSAIIARVEKKDGFSYGNNEELVWVTEHDIQEDYNLYLKQQENASDIITTIPLEQTTTDDSFLSNNAPICSSNTSNQMKGNNSLDRDKITKNQIRKIVRIILIAAILLVVCFLCCRLIKMENPNTYTEAITNVEVANNCITRRLEV